MFGAALGRAKADLMCECWALNSRPRLSLRANRSRVGRHGHFKTLTALLWFRWVRLEIAFQKIAGSGDQCPRVGAPLAEPEVPGIMSSPGRRRFCRWRRDGSISRSRKFPDSDSSDNDGEQGGKARPGKSSNPGRMGPVNTGRLGFHRAHSSPLYRQRQMQFVELSTSTASTSSVNFFENVGTRLDCVHLRVHA